MKKALIVPLILLVLTAKAQTITVAEKDLLTTGTTAATDCQKVVSTELVELSGAPDEDVIINVTLTKPAGALDKFQLMDVLTQKPVGKALNGKILTFTCSNVFATREDLTCVIYQFVDQDEKPLKGVIKVTNKNPKPKDPPRKNVDPDITIEIPRIEHSCDHCAPDTNLVIYNFKDHSLKTKFSTSPEVDLNNAKKKKQLPKVGGEFAFQVLNVNPFRFDVTISNETEIFNTESTDILKMAFTAPAGAVAAGSNTQKDVVDLIKADLLKLGDQLSKLLIDLQLASDCFNPCEHTQKVVTEIIDHFKLHGYNGTQTLEEFWKEKLGLNEKPADNQTEEFEKLLSIIKSYTTIRLTQSATINYLIPQVQNVDRYIFKLNVTPKAGITTSKRVVNQEIAVDVLGGCKVDISSGLFVTGIFDRKYVLQPDSVSIQRRSKIVDDTGSKINFGLSSLIHFYPRMSKHFSLGGSVGAGVTLTEKPKVRYLLGASALIGRKERIGVTTGAAFGYVDRLSSRYELAADGIRSTSFNDTKVDLQKVLHTSWFVSLTYNIPIRKDKEVKADESSGDSAAKEESKDK